MEHTSLQGRLLLPRCIAVTLLLIHVGLLTAGLSRTFITVDEVMNVAAGVSYWRTGRFFIYRVNPPIAKMVAVLPTLAAQPKGDFRYFWDYTSQRSEVEAGPYFVDKNRAHLFDLVCLARIPGVVWSVLGGWLVFHWSAKLHGAAAGCLALGLWCFEPLVLGHAGLVTTDVPATVAGLAASYSFWRYLAAPSWRAAILAGALLGLAALTKFTLLIFFALWPIVWAVRHWAVRTSRRPATPTFGGSILQVVLLILIAIYVINIGYGCQGTGRALGEYSFRSELLKGTQTEVSGNRFRGAWLGSAPVPFPEDFVRGIDVQRVDFEGSMPSYLAGVWAHHGWWYFYLYALAVKLPLGTLALIIWSLWGVVRHRGGRSSLLDTIALLAPAAAILVFASSQTGYTQHARYVLPALPYLMINAGSLVDARASGRRQWARRLAWCLVIATAISSLRVYPHSLSYFNEAVGGPLAGPDHLLDSNIDWGQDLLYLKAWVDRHPEAKPLKLAYYNFQIDPRLVGLDTELPPPDRESPSVLDRTDPQAFGPQPGYVAISVNFLKGSEFYLADGQGSGRVAHPNEFAYLNDFRPIARAGYSIYIYHITADEANSVRALKRLPPLMSR